MPKISRFRIVNFKYDDNRKYIADEIFEMEGHNTLINLENGGGKSAMLQLALQVMLPNSPLGSRRMIDYFNLDSGTVHILMEWHLDTFGMGKQYLLTGFCCRRGQEGLNYFTYMRPHTGIDEYTIENIPVLSDKREVAGYHEFYRYIQSLSKEPGIRMNLFRQSDQSKYRSQLETYNLFEVEFRAIRTINQSEGGIEKFFEKTRTSRQVIERLIIPSIPSGNEEESGVLVDSFRKHMDNLKTIPELQSRIKTYDIFRKKAEEFLVYVRQYKEIYGEHRVNAENILNLENLLHFALSLSEKEHEEYSYKKNDAEMKKRDLLYMKDSFGYSRNYVEAEILNEKLEQIRSALSKLILEHEAHKVEYDNSLSVNDWLDIKELKKSLMEKEAQLKAIQQERHEWNLKYQRVLSTLESLYTEKLAEIKNDKALLSLQRLKLKEEIGKQENVKTEIEENLKKIDRELYHLKEDQNRLEKEVKKIVSQIEGSYNLLIDPQQSLLVMDNDIEQLKGEEGRLYQDILKIEKRIESTETEIGRTGIKIAEDRKDRDSLEKEVQSIVKRRELLEQKIRNYEIGSSVYKGDILEKIKVLIENQRLEYNRLLSSRLVLENKQLAFSDGRGYIPDYAIKKLVDLLIENDINAIPGSIWLANQNEYIRRKLVECNPYLPYAVIINEKSIDTISFLEERIIDCVEGYPVWILTSSGQAIVYTDEEGRGDEKGGLARFLDNDIFLLNKEAAEFSVDYEKFQDYVDKLKGKITIIDGAVKLKQEELSLLEKLYNDINKFIEEYPEVMFKRKEAELEDKKRDVEKSEKLLGILKKQLDGLKAETEKLNDSLGKTRDRISYAQEQTRLMEQYIEKADEITSTKKASEKLSDEFNNLNMSYDSLVKQLGEMKSRLRELDSRAESLEKTEDNLGERLSDVKSRIDGNPEKLETQDSLQELEAMKSALEQNLKDVNMDNLLELIRSHRNEISRLFGSIKERKTDIAMLESKWEKVPHSRLDELKQELKKLSGEINIKRDEENDLSNKSKILAGRMEYIEKDIREKYEKGPHLFDKVTDEQEEHLNKGILTVDKKLKKLERKLSDIGQRVDSLRKIIDRASEFITDNELMKFAEHTKTEGFRARHRTIDRWDMSSIPDKELAVFYNDAREEYRKSENKLRKKKEDIEKQFGLLYKDSEQSANQNIRGLMSRIGETDIFNYEVIERMFENVFKSIENLKMAARVQLENLDKDRKEMILRCLRRARAVYDEVRSVDRFSKITVGNSKVRAIKIKAPPFYDEQAENLMGQYLDTCIRELTDIRSDLSFDPARIDDEIRKRMKLTNLLDAIAPLNLFRIEVLKPGHNMETSRYIEWEKIISWSGGEKLAGFFAMFIAIISYLRYKKTQWYDSTKVIWIDNPFGQANAGYLLDYIFELANTTNTQVICLTGLQETSIYEKFDVVYSLVHRMLGASNSVIRSRKVKENTSMDSGMYKRNHTQMSLLD